MVKFFLGMIVGLFCLAIVIDDSTPTAIDVYRGNTTLQITYKDSVAIDSVVVWK